MVSVIVPFYNERQEYLDSCVSSLLSQTYNPLEIILVDDGSTKRPDLSSYSQNPNLKVIRQEHKGAGPARNKGVSVSKGEILVFADADMTFDKDFISELTGPIRKKDGMTGTFSKNEYLSNGNNFWSLMWNVNRYIQNGWKINGEERTRMLPESYPDRQKVFRAIKKEEFEKIGGFDASGYTDDWSISEKTGLQAEGVSGAKFFHRNPESFSEVFIQARWFGKNRTLTGNGIKKMMYMAKYCLPFSIIFALYNSLRTGYIQYFFFRIVYDFGVFAGITETYFSENLYK